MRFRLLFLLLATKPVMAQSVNYDNLLNQWITSPDSRDQWSFDEDGTVIAYYNGMLAYYKVSNDTLCIGKSEEDYEETGQEEEYVYGDEEYYEYIPEKDDARFRICKLVPGELVLHPLNVAAVKLIDETPVRYSGNVREKIYKDYLQEIGQAKDKAARAEVINRWKQTQELYVDTIHFVAREWMYEEVKFDSLYYSSLQIGWDSLYFLDVELRADGSFIWHKRSQKRTDGDRSDIQSVHFIPPVVTDDHGEYEEFGEEEPDELEILRERAWNAGDGWYQGRISEEGMGDLLTTIYYIGLSKVETEPLAEVARYTRLQTTLMRFHIWYDDKEKDLEALGMRAPIVMNEFIEEFGWLNAQIVEFGPYTGRAIEFPKAFPVK